LYNLYDSACAFAGVQPLSALRCELGEKFFGSVTQSHSCLHDLPMSVATKTVLTVGDIDDLRTQLSIM